MGKASGFVAWASDPAPHFPIVILSLLRSIGFFHRPSYSTQAKPHTFGKTFRESMENGTPLLNKLHSNIYIQAHLYDPPTYLTEWDALRLS